MIGDEWLDPSNTGMDLYKIRSFSSAEDMLSRAALFIEISSFSCRPYCIEYAGSHLNSKAKRYQVRLVLRWETARESCEVDS